VLGFAHFGLVLTVTVRLGHRHDRGAGPGIDPRSRCARSRRLPRAAHAPPAAACCTAAVRRDATASQTCASRGRPATRLPAPDRPRAATTASPTYRRLNLATKDGPAKYWGDVNEKEEPHGEVCWLTC